MLMRCILFQCSLSLEEGAAAAAAAAFGLKRGAAKKKTLHWRMVFIWRAAALL
jgi:hypothetical protein